jgi:hypothetical protein
MKRFLSALSLALLTGCTMLPPPVTDPVWDFSVSVDDGTGHFIPQAQVTFHGIQKTANDFGWAYFTTPGGCYQLTVTAEHYRPFAPADCLTVDRHKRQAVVLQRDAPPTTPLTASGHTFLQDGHPWRWKGVTCFQCADRFAKGEDIQPFLDAFKGYTLLRVFLWTPVEDWHDQAWGIPSDEALHRFLEYVAGRGWYVELTLVTYATPVDQAQQWVTHYFTDFAQHPNLLIELVNEPSVGRKLDARQIHVPQTAILWTTGGTIDDSPVDPASGEKYGVAHTPRDNEWPRKAKDLIEYYSGGGPQAPTDPPHHYPWVADEPIRPDQAGFVASDYEGYFGVSSLLGAGATFHFESGKFARVPTPDEARCAAAALKALDFFPADAPFGPYSRTDEGSATLRTYHAGSYTVRVRPTDGLTLVPWH